MKILQYIQSLGNDVEKTKVIESLQLLKEELSAVTIPLFEQAAKVFISNRFNNSIIKEFDRDMKKQVPVFRSNHIVTILMAMRNASVSTEALINVMVKSQVDTFLRDGMSVLRANQLQYIEVTSFVVSFARRWLLFLYSLESVYDYTSKDYMLTKEFEREKIYFDKNKDMFFSSLNILLRSPKDVELAFGKIPDISVDPESNVDPSITAGSSEIDPLQFGILPKPINFIYWLRMSYTKRQLKKHELLVEEKQQLELKLLLLKQSKDENPDPKLEKQIAYNENKIEKLRYEIAKIEGKLDE